MDRTGPAAPPRRMPERLRVLSIAHTAVSHAGGRLRYAPCAAAADLDVHLVVPARWYEFGHWREADAPGPGVPVHVLPIRLPRGGPASWYLHHYRGLRRLLLGLRPDVIHLWEEPWSLVALQAARLRERVLPGVPLVLEVDQNIHKRLPPPFEAIRRHVLARTDVLFARSPAAEAVARAGGYRGPAAAIGYGVDEAVFRPSDRAAARAALGLRGLPAGGLLIGYAGRLVEEKGMDDAIAAVAACPVPVPVTLVILGDGPHRASLQRQAAVRGIERRVRFIDRGGPADVARFMAALDAAILLTRTTRHVREQFGRVIIEAQACGVPVIGSACGAIPDVVGDGGWIIPESDPAALAALLAHLAACPAEREGVAIRARANTLRRFTLGIVAAGLADGWRAAHAEACRRHATSQSGGGASVGDRVRQQGLQREARRAVQMGDGVAAIRE